MTNRWFFGYSIITGLVGLFILFFMLKSYFVGGMQLLGIFFNPLALVSAFLLLVAYGSYFLKKWLIPLLYVNLVVSLAGSVFLVAVSGWSPNAKQETILLMGIIFAICYFTVTLRLIIFSRRHRELFL